MKVINIKMKRVNSTVKDCHMYSTEDLSAEAFSHLHIAKGLITGDVPDEISVQVETTIISTRKS